MSYVAKRTYLGSVAIVAMSTAVLPAITGYGTQLFQIVVLVAWGLVARATSGAFADQHDFVVWVVALLLNVLLFSIPAGAVFLMLRRRAPQLCTVLIAAWLLFYLASLFFLFPATDGP